jgi:thiaminase
MAKKANNQEMIGFHKGALTTLAKEREEMAKIVQVVEQLMQMHIKSLKELGVDITKEIKKADSPAKNKKKPIDEMV